MRITITIDANPSESPKGVAGFLREAAERLENAVSEVVGGKAAEPLPEGRLGFRGHAAKPPDIGAAEAERYPFPSVPED